MKVLKSFAKGSAWLTDVDFFMTNYLTKGILYDNSSIVIDVSKSVSTV